MAQLLGERAVAQRAGHDEVQAGQDQQDLQYNREHGPGLASRIAAPATPTVPTRIRPTRSAGVMLTLHRLISLVLMTPP